jgi:mRNA interferase MazF
LKRGDVVLVALPGDYGKPRPAIVIQSDRLQETDSLLVCLVTSTLREAPAYRLDVPVDPSTGLRTASQVQIDKIMAARRSRIDRVVGRLPDDLLAELDRRLAFIIGLGD